jgi:hypothetical protein
MAKGIGHGKKKGGSKKTSHYRFKKRCSCGKRAKYYDEETKEYYCKICWRLN